MELLYVSMFHFQKRDGKTFALPSCADLFFEKYLDVFDSVQILGIPVKGYLDKSALVEMTDPRISVEIAPPNASPKDFVNDGKVRRTLYAAISRAEAVLIKPSGRRGMTAIKIAEKLGKPYMIEMTGDIHQSLLQTPSLLKRLYASVLYRQIKNSIKNCQFGLYVSKDYLQSRYPIVGETLGCSDVVLEIGTPGVLERRLKRIDAFDATQRIDIALVGFYQEKRKGVDVAIRALARLPENYRLSILGNGSEEWRKKWIEYGAERGVVDRIHFPKPLSSARQVLEWLDTMDFFVLPARSEGLPRAILEAGSRGLPIFATNICGIPELLPKDCLIELNDDEKLASLLRQYANDKELMKKAAVANYEKAKEYAPDILRRRRNEFLTKFRAYCEASNQK